MGKKHKFKQIPVSLELEDRFGEEVNTNAPAFAHFEAQTAERDPHYKSTIERASFFSFLHFMWVRRMISKVNSLKNKRLQITDLRPLGFSERAQTYEERLNWYYDEYKFKNPKKSPSLQYAAFKTFSSKFWRQLLFQFINATIRILYAYFLNQVLIRLANTSEPLDEAFKWAGGLFGLIIVNIYITHHEEFNNTYTAMKLKTGIVGMLYKKVNFVSSFSLKQMSLGKIVNLVANDLNGCDRIYMFVNLIVAPFILVGGAAFLWAFYGPICLSGIGYILMTWPIQRMIASGTIKYRRQKTANTDERVRKTNEMIESIRMLKMYAWEKPIVDGIKKLRHLETKYLTIVGIMDGISKTIIASSSIISSLIIFLVHHYTGGTLSSREIFPTLLVMSFLRRGAVMAGAQGFSFMVQIKLVFNRVMSVLELEEIEMLREIQAPKSKENAIEFDEFVGFWTSTHAIAKFGQLQAQGTNINFEQAISINATIKKGTFTAIIGKIRSGKSSLLMSFTGEMPKTSGQLRFQGSMALVEQEPQIFSGTIRDNILFGTVFKKELYIKVIDACCLFDDIKALPNKDLTEIGERGINLSGGQKARVALARAIYSQADLYLLDDPLSGLDTKVAKRLFNKAIMQMLTGKTVLLVTHQVHFVKSAERILVVEEGEVIGDGNFESLKAAGVDITTLMDVKKKVLRDNGETYEMNFSNKTPLTEVPESEKELEQKAKEEAGMAQAVDGQVLAKNAVLQEGGQLFAEEDKLQGVKGAAYSYYLKNIFKPLTLIFALAFFGATETANLLYSRVLGYWADEDFTNMQSIEYLIWILAANLIFNFLKNILYTISTLNGSKKIHDRMLESVSKFPGRFFDTNPVGRVLNRFSNDIGILDSVLPAAIQEGLEGLSYFLVVIAAIWIFNPFLFIPAAVSFVIYIMIFKICKRTILETRGLELSTRSPMYSLFSMTLEGAITIRAYRHSDDFIKKFYKMMNEHSRAQLSFLSSVRLMSFLINYVTEFAVMISLGIVISRKNSTSVAGLLAIQLANLTTYMQFILQNFVMVTILMASTERCMNYIKGDIEKEYKMPTDDKLKLKSWPNKGEIEFKNVSMRYHDKNEYIVKELNMTIKSGEKIGIVGRTGSGSSSLINILMRMVELDHMEGKENSSIKIDGVDIREVGLYLLRHSISIIPQTPVIFSGSVRNNLDPERIYSDKQLHHVLDDINLRKYLTKQNLDIDLGKHGMNFSMGQKQLFCLARAILQKSKVLLLDEATAHVDMETDELIQNKILDYFGNSTIFTIAHRLTTIANYDRVAFLEKGMVLEFDEPYLLLVKKVGDKEITNTEGHFAQLVLQAGDRTAAQIFKVAKRKYYHIHDLPFEFEDEDEKEAGMKGILDGMFNYLRRAEQLEIEEQQKILEQEEEIKHDESEEEKQQEIAKLLNLDVIFKGFQSSAGRNAIRSFMASGNDLTGAAAENQNNSSGTQLLGTTLKEIQHNPILEKKEE